MKGQALLLKTSPMFSNDQFVSESFDNKFKPFVCECRAGGF